MIQFNLIPDVKKEYIKAKKAKRLILSLATLSAGVSIVIVVLLFSFVQIAQKKNINDITDDINKELSATESIEDLDKILTIQNQLNVLTELHEDKPAASRLLGYLTQLTPETVKISSAILNFEKSTMEVSGSADSLASINQYVDTLKFSKYKIGDGDEASPFSDVISELVRSEESASYTINMSFDPNIFDNTLDVSLIIPERVTTRSITGRPSIDSLDNSLFEESTDESTDEGGQ